MLTTIFLNLAALVGIIILAGCIILFLIFVIDMAGGLYEEYKKIREQENE